MMRIEVEKPAGNSGLIMVFDGLLDPSVCSELLVKLQSVWGSSHEGKTLGGVDFTVKTTEDLHISEHAFNENSLTWDNKFYELEMAVTNSLSSAIAIYKQNYRHLDNWIGIQDTGFQVQKYYKNYGYYRPHVDSFPGSNVDNRVLATVVYLNDVDYGGETNFPLHEVKVTPKAGRIVLFPAVWTHLHESCVPLTGDKWIISSFIENTNVNEIKKPVVPPNENPTHDTDHPHDHPHTDIEDKFDPTDLFEWQEPGVVNA